MPDGATLPPAAGFPQRASLRKDNRSFTVLHTANRGLAVPITLVAFLLRLTVAIVVAKTTSAQWLFSQASELGCLADSVVHGHGFSSPFGGHTGPSAFLAPGYPLFIAAVFRLFGAYTKHSAECIVLCQALFGTAVVPAAMWTARQAFGIRTGNLTGVLCAINPWLIGMEAVFWETSLSILLLTTLVGLAVALQRAPSRRLWYAAALALALAAAVNPSLLLSGVALLVIAHVSGPSRSSLTWLAPAFLFLCFCSLWSIRNYRVLHTFAPLRSNMGYELWQGNHPNADGFFLVKLHPNTDPEEHRLYESMGEIAYMQQKSDLAEGWIAAHPGRFAALTLKRFSCFWLGVGRTTTASTVISTGLLSLAGLGALFVLFRRERKVVAVLAVPLLLLPLPYYITHPDFRFWCLLAPVLTVLLSWWLMKARDTESH